MRKFNHDIKTDRHWIKSISSLLQKPIPMYIIGVLTTLMYDGIRERQQQPYFFLNTENLHGATIVKFKIGNAGSEPLRSSEFISMPSVNLRNYKQSQIRSIKISESSRPELTKAFEINKDINNTIHINFSNEALEKGDFLVFEFQHEGDSHPKDWEVLSRIIGHRYGITDYTKILSKTNVPKTIALLWGLATLLIVIRIILFKMYKEVLMFRFWEILFLISLYLAGAFYLYVYLTVTRYAIS